jgi:predicted lipoprotein with Yx(FWY)xxD motif
MKTFDWRKGTFALPVVAVVVLATGCGADNGDAGDAGAASGDGDLVSVATVDDTAVLVDAEGHTLYGTEAEEHGDILCVGACESFWAPAPADPTDIKTVSSDLSGDLGVVERPDGTSQLTFDGLPMYTFSQEDAGELTGDGFTDDFKGTHFVWNAAGSDASAPASMPDKSNGGLGY